MKYKVYHAVNPTFSQPYPALHDCELVAEVEAKDLEEVFRITNHIDHAWWENPEVKWHKPNSRSTSVGDIVIGESEVQYRCDNIGWSIIS